MHELATHGTDLPVERPYPLPAEVAALVGAASYP